MRDYVYDQRYSFLMRKDRIVQRYFYLFLPLVSVFLLLCLYPYSITREYLAKVVSKKELYLLVSEKESSEILNKKMTLQEIEMPYEVAKITLQVIDKSSYDTILLLLKKDLYYEIGATISVCFELEKTTIGIYIFKTMKGWFL